MNVTAPPTCRTLLWRDPSGVPLGLVVSCEWCDCRTRDCSLSCMVCLPQVRRLLEWERRHRAAWRNWLDVLWCDLDEKWVVAEWLEENGQPDAAGQLRDLDAVPCERCQGTGRVRNRWLTVWPHNGEPCKVCCNGKVLKFIQAKEQP